jgi:hypothetical protein
VHRADRGRRAGSACSSLIAVTLEVYRPRPILPTASGLVLDVRPTPSGSLRPPHLVRARSRRGRPSSAARAASSQIAVGSDTEAPLSASRSGTSAPTRTRARRATAPRADSRATSYLLARPVGWLALRSRSSRRAFSRARNSKASSVSPFSKSSIPCSMERWRAARSSSSR